MSPRDRRGGGGPLPREVTISKAMSFVLRHGAEKEGIKLDAQGYANVADLESPSLAWHKLRKLQVTLAEVQEIVRTNDKQRFALISVPPATSDSPSDDASSRLPSSDPQPHTASTDPPTYRIRATQGHSITSLTSASLSLTPLTPATAPSTIVHGTFPTAWRLILASGGLKRMGRNHIHFATDVPGNEKGEVVISGMRRAASVLVWVDVRRAMEVGGLRFWRSENGVVLTEGDERGVVGLEFVGRVVQRVRGGGERVLWEGGGVVGEVVGGEGKGKTGGGRGGRAGGDGGRGRRAGIGGAEAEAKATTASPTSATNGTHTSDTEAIAITSPPGAIAAT